MKVVTYKVFSLCEDFDQDIYPEMYEELSQYNSSDTFVEYTAYSAKYLKENNYDPDLIANRLFELGAGENETVLIHIDY